MPTIAELKAALKAKGIKGYSGKNKAELEAMLAPAYIGQPTLTQVAECLMTNGFDLVRLASMGLYGGRAMLEFNAFWVRRESHQDPQVKFWKAVNGVGSVHRAVVWGY